MKKLSFILFFVTFLVSANTNAFATSWAEMDAQEVNKRAEVIVLGQYNFSSKQQGSHFVFSGYEFNVKKVYRGDVSDKLTAGIDGYDVGWADEFQQGGGEFLLFLEKGEHKFLTPVGGPNGMVQFKNGEVYHHNKKSKGFYENLLKEQSEEPSVETSNTSSDISSADNQNTYVYAVLFFLLVCVVIFFFIKRYRKS